MRGPGASKHTDVSSSPAGDSKGTGGGASADAAAADGGGSSRNGGGAVPAPDAGSNSSSAAPGAASKESAGSTSAAQRTPLPAACVQLCRQQGAAEREAAAAQLQAALPLLKVELDHMGLLRWDFQSSCPHSPKPSSASIHTFLLFGHG